MQEIYLPFFRKYRPQAFCDVVGQEGLVKALSNAIELNRLANAYLFCGPRGTGKTSSARIFAKSLNCVNGPTVLPCQKCPSCVDITNTSGLDVIEIDAATNRGIDDAKELISQVQYAPLSGKYKIFIIDEVHMLSKEAFNALLKTFEEPPKNVIFILATTEPHKVIETIVSRCQRFDFRRISVDDIVKKLKDISTIEKIKITDEALLTIAKSVSGGLRDSLALLDQVSILGAKEEITKDLIDNLIGKVTFEPMFNLLETILNCDIEAALTIVEEIYSKGNEPRNFIENFIEFLRNYTIVLNSKNPQTVTKFASLNIDEVDKIIANKVKCSTYPILQILNKAIEFYREIKSTTNPYLWVELMVIEMCRLNTIAEPQAAKEQVMQEKPVKTKPEPVQPKVEHVIKEPVQANPKAEEEAKIQDTEPKIEEILHEVEPETKEILSDGTTSVDTEDIWPRVISAIKSPVVLPFFRDVPQSVDISNDSITIGFVHPNAITQAKSDSKYTALKDAIESVLEKKYEIIFMQVPKGEKAPNMLTVQNVKQAAPAKPQYVQDEFEHEMQGGVKQEIGEVENKEKIQKSYSDKTRLMLETFNGKVVD